MRLPAKKLGRTALELSVIGFGGTALGNMYSAVTERAAAQTLDAAYASGVRYFDTAPLYGHGLSELRTGSGLRSFADQSVIVSSKVGWRLKPTHGADSGAGQFEGVTAFSRFNDYSYDGAMRSFEDSLQRLGVDRIDMLLIHDADRRNQGERQPEVFRVAMAGAYKALLSLREQGLVRAIGCGLNEWQACQQFAEAGDFDCFLLAGRYTLLEQESLNTFLPLCQRRGIGIVLGGPYNSGILATGAVSNAFFDYAPASETILKKVARIEQVCADHQVPLKAAALQFPLFHPCITSVIPGMRSPQEVQENLQLIDVKISPEFWRQLKSRGLMEEAAVTA